MSLLRVYSHPRSGTNLLMAFIAINFYPGLDLETRGRIGHWKARKLDQVNPYGKLAGTHYFMHDEKNRVVQPCVYLYRDGRAVALSLWHTKAFQRPSWRKWCLSRFLKEPLDWGGSPGNPRGFGKPIAAHWRAHLDSWEHCEDEGILKVRFEDILTGPRQVRDAIAEFYDMKPVRGLKLVTEKVGWLPNEGRIDAWREHFSEDDLAAFYELAGKPDEFWGYWER